MSGGGWAVGQEVTIVGGRTRDNRIAKLTTIATVQKRKITTSDGGEWAGLTGRMYGQSHERGYTGPTIRPREPGDADSIAQHNFAYRLAQVRWDEFDVATLRACWTLVKEQAK